MVSRIYVEKKPGFDIEAQQLLAELRFVITEGLSPLTTLRIINLYDIEGIDADLFERCVPVVFSEPQVDTVSSELPVEGALMGELGSGRGVVAVPEDVHVFAVEALPGQFDQRADSAAECVQLISQGDRPRVRCAKVYVFEGAVSDEALAAIKRYVINPVESREASLALLETLTVEYPEPADVEVIEGFTDLDEVGLAQFLQDRGLAMDLADITFFQQHFKDEGRNPTITEVKVVDTYWSDHCRHTTFGTELTNIQIDDDVVKLAFDKYLAMRAELGREHKPVCLMDMGTIGAKYLRAHGGLAGLDESEEVNACTVKCTVDVDGEDQDWLFLFKNETHNHPTEIEPFGGAATCVGGAIRDPLSGRSYVYQAMRVTGAGDPLVPVSETLEGKLPQRKLVTTAAAGYSSYGNQIGLATGQVHELYHPGYVAKRMEVGAVVGATPADHVRREEPAPGDKIVLLGGRTGRDGIGGATGSSKTQNVESVETSGAEVQKGNAPVERKIQRLFRRGEACRLIKRCNDFGAGGVSVSIGELCDGLMIELDQVPKKYEGLDGTELAISESQERMSVALAAEDVDEFISYAHEENLEATVVATVTEEKRLCMVWRGNTIVDISRAFLNSNGAPKHQDVHVEEGGSYQPTWEGDTLSERMNALVSDLNVCSNKGLGERFDSTIGAATVLMPFGGKHQLTPAQAMVAKFPVDGETTTASAMAWGFNPYLSEKNQFKGAYLAVVESVARLVATGFTRGAAYLSLQEYFERLRNEPARWGKPTASVLGALMAQVDLGIGAIGGKDSMSGSFEELDVPPTLISFAVSTGSVDRVTSPEFKQAGARVVRIAPRFYDEDSLIPDVEGMNATFDMMERLIGEGALAAAATPGYGCTAETLFKMCVGNSLGVRLADDVEADDLFALAYGSFVVELAEGAALPEGTDLVSVSVLGEVTQAYEFAACDEAIDLAALQEVWEGGIESVFPYRREGEVVEQVSWTDRLPLVCSDSFAKPRVVIPVFPGTNCEYDTARAFERAGALPQVLVVNNLTPDAVAESTKALVRAINESQIVMLPGGFSGGDEPDGSAKFITAFFRSPEVTEAVRDLLKNRDGLMLGICNGFQALVKLGLVPYGDIVPAESDAPTLTFNTVGRHQSGLVRTRIASSLSPWLSCCEVGDIHTVAISHGEGRFVATPEQVAQLAAAGQIATQYVDETGVPSMDWSVNPNGSVLAIEGITSPDGRVFGKMGHTERSGNGLYKNVPGDLYQPLFEGGVNYFS
ncbi:MAG: phosphoribosylformylglycinamidine synthase [Eggerthellaceae bacterium]